MRNEKENLYYNGGAFRVFHAPAFGHTGEKEGNV